MGTILDNMIQQTCFTEGKIEKMGARLETSKKIVGLTCITERCMCIILP